MFTWIPAYEQLAKYVLEYEKRQPELIAILKQIGITPFNDQDTDGNIIPLSEIDGLSFFCYLNKYGDQKRLQLLQALCREWNIVPLPEDVAGLPTVNAQKVWLFPVKHLRVNNEIQRLWTFYKALVNDSVTNELFEDVLHINGVGKAKLTELMFILQPDTYLCLNRSVKSFLQEAHLPTHFSNLTEYLTNIHIAKEVFSKSFPELSKEAYEYVPGSLPSMVAEEEIIYQITKPATSSFPLNIILYGPPGTGKTYMAIDKAVAISDAPFYKERQNNRTAITDRFQDLLLTEDNKSEGRIAFCTFHQSMSYEDFVEGIKPQLEADKDEHLQYKIKDGIFKTMAALATASGKSAKKMAPPSYVLIIDEINRGNISQVFGELITLMEEDKRTGNAEALTVVLPYSKKSFSIPPNLYIIGTMNTADRNIETLDTALRRRFVFEEIPPKPNLLSPQQLLNRLYNQYADTPWEDEIFRKAADALYDLLGTDAAFEYGIKDKNEDANVGKIMELKDSLFTGVNLEKLLTAINSRLSVLLSNDHTIGHAWFMEVYSLTDLQSVFKHKILPLLQEYFFNNYAKIGLVLGKPFVHSQPVTKSLFAAFDNGDDMAADYMEKIMYTLVDPFTLPLKAFRSIYK